MPRQMYLLGAGASFGSGPCFPTNPPLGAALFHQLQSIYPRWKNLESAERLKFESGDFELGFGSLMEQRQDLVPGLMRDMARYFTRFYPLPGNHYFEFVARLIARDPEAALATLNYDLLLDAVLERHFGTWWLGKRDGRPHFIKPHGNINLVPDIGRGNRMKGMRVAGAASYFSGPVSVLSVAELLPWLDKQEPDAEDNDLAPAFSIYAKSKKVLWAPEEAEAHQRKFLDESNRSATVTVCGVRCLAHDDHIWGALHRSPARLHFWAFDRTSENEFLSWAESRQADVVVERGDFKQMIEAM